MGPKSLIIIISAILILSVGGYFGFNYYRKNQAEVIQKELETLKNTPESEKCIVTIRGDKYDVTTFRSKHPGGNIFKCGEDMTSAFNKQHGDKQLQQIQIYKVTQ